jgi:hypothetical protein
MKTRIKGSGPVAKNAKQKLLLAKLKRERELRTGYNEELKKLAGIWENRTDIDPTTVRQKAWTKK